MPTPEQVRSAARHVVAEMIGRTVKDDASLISSGLIDSLSILKLIGSLEDRLSVTIPPDDLQPDDGGVVLHAEELEAECEKKWIAGKANESGKGLACAEAECVAAVEEQVLRDAAVDECVAAGLKEVTIHPNAQNAACDKSQCEREHRLCAAGERSRCL